MDISLRIDVVKGSRFARVTASCLNGVPVQFVTGVNYNSGAVNRYTMMEIKDRFSLMNIAFKQEDYRVDKNLNIIEGAKKKDC